MEEITFESIWNTLSKIDCSGHTETKRTGKNELTYLSWTWAWAELMKRYPYATYEIREWDGRPWLEDPVAGVLVMTTVDIGGNRRTMWLPAMDGANNALKREQYSYFVKGYDGSKIEKKVEAVDMCSVNKAIMRCLVKNLAMFGLGLNIYAGEDLPVGVDEDKARPQPKPADQNQRRARVRSEVSDAAAPVPAKAAAPAPAPATASTLAKQAWKSFKELPDAIGKTRAEIESMWDKRLMEVTGGRTSHASELEELEWRKLIAKLDIEKCM